MKKIILVVAGVVVCVATWFVGEAQSIPIGSGFTYQGRMLDGGQPGNGSYDLRFALADALAGGNYVGNPVTNAPVLVSNGVFTVVLDFGGSAFDGTVRWVELGVRTNGSASPYIVLAPRQAVTPTPYALYALGAATAGTASNLSAGAVLTGNGAGITNLAGANIAVATITSNQLDAATWKLATNQTGVPSLGGAATNLNSQGLTLSLPATSDTIIFTNYSYLGGNDVCDWLMYWGAHGLTTNETIQFNGPGGGNATVLFQGDHASPDGTDPELILTSSGSIAIKPSSPGYHVGTPYPVDRHIQMGGPGDYRSATMIGNDHTVSLASPLGWSDPLEYLAQYWSNGPQAIYPCWQLWMTDTNGNAALRLYPNIDDTIYPPYTNWPHAYTTPSAQWRVGTVTNEGLDVWGTVNVYGSMAVTNGLTLAGAPMTNNGMVWLALATNGTPGAALPNGSIATTTNGNFFIYSNGWKKVF